MAPKKSGNTSEKRRDPYSNKMFTFQEACQFYKDQYSQRQIKDYWHQEMKVVEAEQISALSAAKEVDTNEESSTPNQCSSADARVSFCPDPKTIGEKFTSTYDKDPVANFASVNPGDKALMVGGSTLNGQFANDLWNHGWQQTDKYAAYHDSLFKLAGAEVGKLVAASPDVLASNPNIQAGYVRKASEAKVGVVFIDVFKPDACIHGVAKNFAMVYTVGPRRQDMSSDAAFLAEVERTAENVSRACGEFNATAGEKGILPIEVLRIPLVSGGAFAGKCPKDAVAAALIRGLRQGSTSDSPELNFAFDGDIFRKTWDNLSKP